MNIILGIVLAYLILPIIGELYLYISNHSLYSGSVDALLIINNSIHVLIIIFFGLIVINSKKIQPKMFVQNPNLIIYRCWLITLVGFILIFSTFGYKFIVQGMYRGDIRVSLGILGPLVSWMIRFMLPAILALSTICFISSDTVKPTFKSIYYLTFALVIISAISTGYKSTIIIMILPALSIVFIKKKIFGLVFKVSPIIILLLTITTAIVRNTDVYSAFWFLLHRMTVMVAYGTIGVWNYFPQGAEFNESIKLTYNLFGNNIAEYLLGHDRTTVEFLSTNLSRLMTYLAYPDTEGALAGTVNVTVTNFGEAFYIFGYYYPIYSIIAGLIFFSIVKKFIKSWNGNNLVASVVSLTYIFAVVLPWLNSSSFLILISLPTLVWLAMTIIVLYLVVKMKPLI